MKKLMILLFATIVLVGCQSAEGYKYSLIRQIAEKEGIPMSEVQLSFQESCMVAMGPQRDNEARFYVKTKNSSDIYEYYSNNCGETTLSDFSKTLYSSDGELPETLERGAIVIEN